MRRVIGTNATDFIKFQVGAGAIIGELGVLLYNASIAIDIAGFVARLGILSASH